VPFAATRPTANGLRVQRVLLRIDGHRASPILPGATLARGDVVVSGILVERTVPDSTAGSYDASPSDFVVVEDGIPSIAEPIEDDRTYLADAGVQPDDDSYWATVKETQRHPDRTTRVIALKPGASMTVYQVWRAAFTGRASIPPSRAFDMYDDGIAGNSEALEIAAQ